MEVSKRAIGEIDELLVRRVALKFLLQTRTTDMLAKSLFIQIIIGQFHVHGCYRIPSVRRVFHEISRLNLRIFRENAQWL